MKKDQMTNDENIEKIGSLTKNIETLRQESHNEEETVDTGERRRK